MTPATPANLANDIDDLDGGRARNLQTLPGAMLRGRWAIIALAVLACTGAAELA